MDICMVRRNHNPPESGMAEYTLEHRIEGDLHIYKGNLGQGCKID